MSTSPFTLTEEDVRSWTESRFVERGTDYYEKGAIMHPRVEENVLRALCRGSRPHPYEVRARLDEDGIVDAHCSCPMGRGGRCKHVVALLLTWLHDPDEFATGESLEAAIASLPREELEGLLRKIVTRHPGLENLVRSAAGSDGHVNEEWVREQVQKICAVDRPGEGWEEIFSQDWQSLFDLAAGARDRGQWGQAVTVAAAMTEELGRCYEDQLHPIDRENRVLDWMWTPAGLLADAVREVEDEAVRRRALEALFCLIRDDIEVGGLGMSGPAWELVVEVDLPAEERELVSDWARAARSSALPGEKDEEDTTSTFNYPAETFTRLLVEVQGEALDDEEYLALCREVGLSERVVRRLLARDRVDEAVEEVRDLPSHKLETMIGLFEQEDRVDAIAPLVEERLEEESHLGLLRWQVDHLREEVASEKRYQAARRRYFSASGTEGLEAFEAAARELDFWEEAREEIVDHLTEEGDYDRLVEFYLEMGEIESALDVYEEHEERLRPAHARRRYLRGTPLALRVARAAEEPHPDRTAAIYEQVAAELVAEMGREKYRKVASMLAEARARMSTFGEEDRIDAIVRRLRSKHHRKRAFQDEMDKAGLKPGPDADS